MSDDDNPLSQTPEEIAEQYGSDLWSARPELTTIRDSARASMASPYAVLGCTLATVAEALPPSVVLPPIGNGSAAIGSLNVFIALVAPSGVGKGVASRTAEGVLDQQGPRRAVETLPLGSGEGIAAAFLRSDAGKDDPPEDSVREVSVRFDIAEIDTFTSLVSRQGSTVDPEVRKVWSGEALGTANANPATKRVVPAHRYRATIIAGVQPRRAAGLLKTAAGGTLQRFVLLPAMDPEAPEETPDLPPTLGWRSPYEALRTSDNLMLSIDGSVHEEIRVRRLDRLRGFVDDDNGHRDLSRLKVAALLGILAGRREVTAEDWYLAGLVMSESDLTLDRVKATLGRERREAAVARGEDNALKEDATEDAHIKRTVTRLRSLIRDGQQWSRGTLRKSLTPSTRKFIDTALDRLALSGEVNVWEGDGQGSSTTWVQISSDRGRGVGVTIVNPAENPENMREAGGDESVTPPPTPSPLPSENTAPTVTPDYASSPLRSADSRGTQRGDDSVTPSPQEKMSKTPRQQDLVLAYITERGASSPKDIAAGLADVIPGFSASKASVALDRLHKDEAVVSVGHGVWNLPGAADPQVDGQLSMFPDPEESDGRKAS